METMPNAEFLASYLAKSPSERWEVTALLELDVYLISQKIDELEAKSKLLSDMLDFNKSDRDVQKLQAEFNRVRERLKAILVDYPEPAENRVTLGSRVHLRQQDALGVLDVVGFSVVYNRQNDEPPAVSLEAPIVRAIIGLKVGQVALLHLGIRQQELEILSVDQEALKQEGQNYES